MKNNFILCYKVSLFSIDWEIQQEARENRQNIKFYCFIEGQLIYSVVLLSVVVTVTYQFSSVAKSYPTLCNPMDCSMPGFPVHHQLPDLAQTHVHQLGDAIKPSHPLSSPSLPAFNLSQHQGLFQRVNSLHQVAKVLELQLQHESFQCRTEFLQD